MSWSPDQYTKFEHERNRPISDLVARIETTNVKRAVDIGCGPGNSTEILQSAFKDAETTGIDSSPDMITAARQRLPQTTFEVADITTWKSQKPVDVILANASLQWVPDHEHLFPRLLAMLSKGGSLAIQMPDNLDEPAHTSMREIAAKGLWASKLEEANQARTKRHAPSWHFETLTPHAASLDIWQTTYFHPLEGPEAIVEWFEGSGLRPYLDKLEPAEKDSFLEEYRAAMAKAYPALSNGTVLLPFPRLFIVAVR